MPTKSWKPLRRVGVHRLPFLIWKGLLLSLQRLADAVLQARNRGALRKRKPPLRRTVLLVPRQHLGRWQHRSIQCIRGQDKTTLGVSPGLPGGKRRGQGALDDVFDLPRRRLSRWSPPFAVACYRANAPPCQAAGLSGLRAHCQCLLGISGACEGGRRRCLQACSSVSLWVRHCWSTVLSTALLPRLEYSTPHRWLLPS